MTQFRLNAKTTGCLAVVEWEIPDERTHFLRVNSRVELGSAGKKKDSDKTSVKMIAGME